jgi:hypothetical protein
MYDISSLNDTEKCEMLENEFDKHSEFDNNSITATRKVII